MNERIANTAQTERNGIVVRGMSERWNEASLDGVTLPSTEANAKAFSFDLIPTNIIDNVSVSKSPTPDMNASFAGGFVQIKTKAIPSENFMNISIGGTWNSVSTGKTQYHRERGKLDWLGFDDGRRTFPKNLMHVAQEPDAWIEQKIAQTHRFADMGDNFSIYNSRTPLSNNLQFSMGRIGNSKRRPEDRLGFAGSLSYRNTQQQTVIDHQGRGSWTDYLEAEQKEYEQAFQFRNEGHTFKYGTVLSGILNGGWQRGTSQVNFRNMYTRKYDNDLTVITGWDENASDHLTEPPHQTHYNSPTFQDLLQNKLDGERMLGKVKLNWELAHTYVHRNEKDAINTEIWGNNLEEETFWDNTYVGAGEDGTKRRHYDNKERDVNWSISAELPFDIGEHLHTTVKAGYMGAYKKNNFLFEEVEYRALGGLGGSWPGADPKFMEGSVAERTNPFNMTANGLYWHPRSYEGGDSYEAAVDQHSPYIMFDHRWDDLVRLVWGARAEFYGYNEISNAVERNDSWASGGSYKDYLLQDKKWQFMPSVNLTVTPFEDFNIRMGYNRSMIRPQFMERTAFSFWDPTLSGFTFSRGVVSSTVDGADFKVEWYPGSGEIISAGMFYRFIKDPIERMLRVYGSSNYYGLQNNGWAENWGFEFELRKNFSFIADHPILRNLYITGNATITNSKVQTLYYGGMEEVTNPDTGEKEKTFIVTPRGENRPMYGQTPLNDNDGLICKTQPLCTNLAIMFELPVPVATQPCGA